MRFSVGAMLGSIAHPYKCTVTPLTSGYLAYVLVNEATFILSADASKVGIGAILSQNLEGRDKVIAYASRSLTETERKYGITERECFGGLLGYL